MSGGIDLSKGGEVPGTTGAEIDPEAVARAEAEARAKAEAARIADAQRAYEARFQYGGHAGGSAEAARRYHSAGEWAQGRRGEVIDYSQSNWDRAQAGYARNNQGEAMGLMAARARGSVPSIAQQQANRDIGRAVADQSSIAASARGPAGLALAQQQAAANSAGAISGISQQAQIAGAQERLAAEQAYFGAATGIRGGDMQSGAMAAQQAQAQATINTQQRVANDQYQLGMTGYETDVQKAQLAAQQNKVATENGLAMNQASLAQQQGQHDDNRTDKYIAMGLGAAGTAAAIGVPLLLGGGGGSGGSNNMHEDKAGHSYYGDVGPDGGNLNPNSPGEYDPNKSDVSAKQNIRHVGGGLAGPVYKKADSPATRAEVLRQWKAEHPDEPSAGLMGSKKDAAYREALIHAAITRQPLPADPATQQLARGLAPSTYDYKDGYGTPGPKMGPMANAMAENPLTATAVRRDPGDGLLSIDSADGLKVALGGVGHLSEKQMSNEERIAKLEARGGGLLQASLAQQRPSVAEAYLAHVRRSGP